MDRRAFLGTLAGSVLAAPLAAEAQQAARIPRLGYLSNSSNETLVDGAFMGDLATLAGSTVAPSPSSRATRARSPSSCRRLRVTS